MIRLKQDEKQFKDRSTFLVALAIKYIQSHSGYIGVDDDIFYDDAECDGGSLADDLQNEFDINDDELEETY